jgi:cyclopropane fatty-acyl-phospholipid synthase-like methyltransferase
VLKPGGQLLLCDVTLRHKLSVVEQIRHVSTLRLKYLSGYLAMKRAYAVGKSEALEYYRDNLNASGFTLVQTIDISDNVYPTIDCWRANIATHRSEILRTFSQKRIDDFLAACDFLTYIFKNNMMGYGLVKAIKPDKG